MTKQCIAIFTCRLPRRGALSPSLSCGALVAALLSSGCVGARGEGLADVEELGHAKQAVLDSVLDHVSPDDRGFEISFNNIYEYNKPYYTLRYGIGGSPSATVIATGGTFRLDGGEAGAPYTFSARACNGSLLGGGLGNPCSDWSAPVAAIKPYSGSSWVAASVGADALALAWGAGYYVNSDGANVALPICSASCDGSQYLGYWRNDTCAIGHDSAASTYPNADVLLNVPQAAHWGAYISGLIPRNALRGGFSDGRSIYACRTPYQGGNIPGWTAGRECNIAWEGTHYAAPASASQILSF